MTETERVSMGQMYVNRVKDLVVGTSMQAVVFPFGKLRAFGYVNLGNYMAGEKVNWSQFPRNPRQMYNGVFFMTGMRCLFSNAIPYLAVKSAKPDAGRAEMFGRLVGGTVAGVFCFNLADAQRQLTLRKEQTGFLTLLKPKNLLMRTRGYTAGLTRTVMYNAILTGDHSKMSYGRMLLSCMYMTFFTGPIDYLAALKREHHTMSYWRIIMDKMRLNPKHPQFMDGLKTILLMSTIRMCTLTFEIFAFKVAVRQLKKYKENKKKLAEAK